MTKLTNVGLSGVGEEPADTDRLYIVTDVAGTPTSKYIDYSDLVTNVGLLDAASNTWTGNHIVAGDILNSITTGDIVLSGSSTATTGANLILYGQSHATYPGIMQFRINATESARFTSSGRLGIASTAPSAQLHVIGGGVSVVPLIAQSPASATEPTQAWSYNGTDVLNVWAKSENYVIFEHVTVSMTTGAIITLPSLDSFIVELYNTNSAIYGRVQCRGGYNTCVEIDDPQGGITVNSKSTADQINVYYESSYYHIQNSYSGTRNISIFARRYDSTI